MAAAAAANAIFSGPKVADSGFRRSDVDSNPGSMNGDTAEAGAAADGTCKESII
jgi:hypothetical protein